MTATTTAPAAPATTTPGWWVMCADAATGPLPKSAAMRACRAANRDHLTGAAGACPREHTIIQAASMPETGLAAAVAAHTARDAEMVARGFPPNTMEYLGRDADGYLVVRNTDHLGNGRPPFIMDYRLTECHRASAKGSMAGDYPATVCRSCYAEIDEAIGGMPSAPYHGHDGTITATEVIGWGTFPG